MIELHVCLAGLVGFRRKVSDDTACWPQEIISQFWLSPQYILLLSGRHLIFILINIKQRRESSWNKWRTEDTVVDIYRKWRHSGGSSDTCPVTSDKLKDQSSGFVRTHDTKTEETTCKESGNLHASAYYYNVRLGFRVRTRWKFVINSGEMFIIRERSYGTRGNSP